MLSYHKIKYNMETKTIGRYLQLQIYSNPFSGLDLGIVVPSEAGTPCWGGSLAGNMAEQ